MNTTLKLKHIVQVCKIRVVFKTEYDYGEMQ